MSPSVAGAHPRSRGENIATQVDDNTIKGSSPLTRGKLSSAAMKTSPMGLIPAHAGKTLMTLPHQSVMGAHPRSRGENSVKSVVAKPINGSSPLTRGKPIGARRDRRLHRLIPAHAGKTGSSPARAGTRRAHPRSRGENTVVRPQGRRERGSSPLTRGKHRPRQADHARDGLIPAHAGKTHEGGEELGPVKAHPRSRGENLTPGTGASLSAGSSPLTRGQRIAGRGRVRR